MYINQCNIEALNAGNEYLVVCTGKCVFRDEDYSVIITLDEYHRILKDDELIQDIIPHVHPAEREFLITGISPLGYEDLASSLYKGENRNIKQSELFEKKSNWKDFDNAINKYSIRKLYHFTDKSNLDSIENVNGLLSYKNCIKNGLIIKNPGGSELSRRIDKQQGLDSYIRLSFCANHPMLYVALKDGRIKNPVILEISAEVIYLRYTKFSNQNTLKSEAVIGDSITNFDKIDFSVFKQNYFDLNESKKASYQAEVLVLDSLPNRYIERVIEI